MRALIAPGGRAAICGLSNAFRRTAEQEENIRRLRGILGQSGTDTVLCPGIFQDEREKMSPAGCAGRARARVFMECALDESIGAIFDISGGDDANEVLEYLDYDALAARNRRRPLTMFGYSDLTTVLNAVHGRAGIRAGLYQIRNLLTESGAAAWRGETLASFSCRMIRGAKMEGEAAGGNIRCLLKLAGTPYMPDLKGRLLFLESNGGDRHRTLTAFSQLRQMGVFEKINGLLLGTFTALDAKEGRSFIRDMAMSMTGDIPLAMTEDIGHGETSKCLLFGRRYRLKDGVVRPEEIQMRGEAVR